MNSNNTRSIHAASMIFSPSQILSSIAAKPRELLDVMQQIYADPETLNLFQSLSKAEQEALIQFCMGNRDLNITYDPFFRNIFNPEHHPERLDRFLSAILGQTVKVRTVLPREGIRLSAESSLMIMDVLVELLDGSLINVEMQKVGYHFPIERTFCYGADLLVRKYDRIRSEMDKRFTYQDMKPVYVIVLMEKSPSIFHHSDKFLHHSEFQLDTGIKVRNLLNFIYIPLDFFLKMPHNELTELEAWMYFLSSDDPLHIQRIIEKFPFFRNLYQDIIEFRYHPKELISMFSESLLIADRNTVKLMIDELRAEKAAIVIEMNAEIEEKRAEIEEQKAEIEEQKAEIEEQKAEIEEQRATLAEKETEIKKLKQLLAEANKSY